MGNNYGFVSTGFYRLLEWLWFFIYLNLLWLGFTLLGVIVVGVLPATLAVMAVMQRFVTGDKDFSIFRSFFEAFKTHFFKANIIGLFIGVLSYLLWFNYHYLLTTTGGEAILLALGWNVTLVVVIVFVLYSFPLYLYQPKHLKTLVKDSLLLVLATPLSFLSMVISVGLVGAFLSIVPGMIPFLGIALLSWVMMWNMHQALLRVARKKDRLENHPNAPIIGHRVKEQIRALFQN